MTRRIYDEKKRYYKSIRKYLFHHESCPRTKNLTTFLNKNNTFYIAMAVF
jgi:hypothetical protein